ncbi:hypothetical protein JL722_12921 [Aureococcus anophagefferens]|nr:hypothetical protein JL722_12921 [Aureococcus anophagefferens]
MADDDAEETVVDGSEASEEEEALSDAEKLAIVQHFLLQAPPGEYGEVLKDASQLVDDGVLSAGMLAGIARAYNTRELRVAVAEDGARVILCDASEIAPTRYVESDEPAELLRGGWASTWTAAVDGAGYAVSGSVRVRAHYFEDGNVQLQSAKTVEAAKCADVAAIAALVEETEGALQRGLEDMYENMSAETFKAMRRVMPISRQKMKWNINEIAPSAQQQRSPRPIRRRDPRVSMSAARFASWLLGPSGASTLVVEVQAAAAALALYRRRRTATYSLRPENALPANQLAPKQLEEPGDPDRLARRIETVLRRRTARVIVVMERLCDGHNFSAAFRTCEALGVQHVCAAGKRMNDMAYSSEVDARNAAREQMSKTELAAAGYKDGTIVRVTPGSRRDRRNKKAARAWAGDVDLDQAHASLGRGAARFLSLRTFESTEACVAALRAAEGCEIWCTDLGQGAKVLDQDAPWLAAKALPKRLALVVGTESTGVSNAFLDAADERCLNLYGADACGDLVREGDIAGGRSADELRRDWAGHLGRDDDAVAGILKALEAGAAPLDDLRRPDAFREHNGKIRKDARVAVRREKAAQEGPS